MNLFRKTFLLFFFIVIISNVNCAEHGYAFQQSGTQLMSVPQVARLEHISLSVPDPVAMVKWYTENLGMVVVREGTAPNFNFFIADSGKHILLELANNADYVPIDLPKVNYSSMHLAFMVKNIALIKKKLLAEGAAIASDISRSKSGDQVLVLRDPWGLPIQFIERANAILKFSDLRPEHFEVNIFEAKEQVKWYVENLGLKIVRQGGETNYFIADSKDNMMLEFNQIANSPVLEFEKINYNSFHIAFMIEDIEAIKEKLIFAGAKLAEDIKKTASGDQVLMLRDPWGKAIQFVKRVKPMIK